jgi:fatty acid desaturase
MYKQIVEHRAYVETKLAKELSAEERKQLAKYHSRRVRDFQHERLIHLLVTFFFAGLFLGSFVTWFVLPFSSLFWPLTVLTTLLLVLELAYIRHYYQLENSVQSLYTLSEKLGKLD